MHPGKARPSHRSSRRSALSSVHADLPRIKQFPVTFPRPRGERAYFRLHGRNEKGWLLNGYDVRYDYLYNARELRELKRRMCHRTAGMP